MSELGLASQRWAALLTALWSEKPALFSALWYYFKARNKEHPDQTWVAKTSLWDTGDLNQDLLRWRRKLSSILSHPGGVPLLPNNHFENWGGGAQMPRKLLKENVWGHAALCGSWCNQCASLWFSTCFSIWVSKESRQKRQKVDCIFSVGSFLLILTQVFSSLDWEIISISGTKLSGTPSIKPANFTWTRTWSTQFKNW